MNDSPRYEGNLLSPGEIERTKAFMLKRLQVKKARYFCFRMQDALANGISPEEAGIPQDFIDYVERLKGFEVFGGWKGFAKRWDLRGSNPFTILLRLRSVWEEWDQVMERVAIPLNATPEEIEARQKVLIEEYNRRYPGENN